MLFLVPRAHFRLSGPDRVRYLNGQVTQNIQTLALGQTKPACVTDAKGRLQAELWVTPGDDALLLDTAPELEDALFTRLNKYLIADDALLEPDPDTFLLHSLSNPAAEPLLAPFLRLPVARLGLPGWDIRLTRAVWTLLEPALSKHLDYPQKWESLRVLQGVPKWGNELDTNILPPEAGLDSTHIDFHKGCYIGQEIISRIKSVGRVNKKLVRWHLSSLLFPSLPAPIFTAPSSSQPGLEVGLLTSAALTPEGPRGLGYLKQNTTDSAFVLASGDEILPLSHPERVS
jgi:folate-binding protein YgfZ